MSASDLTVRGNAIAYRLYDIGYEIDLDEVSRLLGPAMLGRTRPARAEARTFEIRQPPVAAMLGERELHVGARCCRGALTAHLFDFGVCSLRFDVPLPGATTWSEFTGFGTSLDNSSVLARFFDAELQELMTRIRGGILRPRVAPVVEEYVVFRVHGLEGNGNAVHAAEVLTDDHLVPLLLGEQRPLSAPARKELLGSRFSYYADDLAVLTWDNALVVEPRVEDHDVEFVLEFANAQLLELRVYDAELDAELPALYARISATRRRRLPSGRFRALLGDVQTRVADVTEVVERADNAFKVTDDVYLARIYDKALELFRERNWRAGIDRKLSIFRETYAMLNGEAQAVRAEILEVAIVLLIVFEIILSFVR